MIKLYPSTHHPSWNSRALFDASRSTSLSWSGSYQLESTVIPMTPFWYSCIIQSKDFESPLYNHLPQIKHTVCYEQSPKKVTKSPGTKFELCSVTCLPWIHFDRCSLPMHEHLGHYVQQCKVLSKNLLQCNFHTVESTGLGHAPLKNIQRMRKYGFRWTWSSASLGHQTVQTIIVHTLQMHPAFISTY